MVDLSSHLTWATRALQDVSWGRKSQRSLMRIEPQPLIAPDARLIVLFSPKAACTNVTIWFFQQLGRIAEAREYSRWPHRYRLQPYYDSALYRRASRLDLTGFKVVRVIRDPYDRVASSFRHAIRARRIMPVIAEHLGDPDMMTRGMSFEQFMTFLESVDIATCDPHFRLQRHPVEDLLPVDYLINISTEDLNGRLREIERDLGLPPPGEVMTKWLAELSHRKRPHREFAATPDLHSRRFTKRQAARGPWPSHDALLTPAIRERLKRLYAADIAAYLKAPTPSQ